MYLFEINWCKIQITIKKIKNDALLFNTCILMLLRMIETNNY